MSANPIGYLILTSTPPEEIPPTAKLVEELGYGELWVAEDYFAYDGFLAAAAALDATESITVGLGIVSAVVRHPAVTAMAIASIARSHPGRFQAGIGHGATGWMHQMGVAPKSPLTAMRESVTAIDALLRGETVNADGRYVTLNDVTLWHPPTETVPLLTGVVGPKSLELSGAIADGTIISVLAGPTYVRYALEHTQRGAEGAGRSEHRMPVLALASISADRDVARANIRGTLAFYLSAMKGSALTEVLGWNDEIAQQLADGGVEGLAQWLPDEWIDELVLAGSAADLEVGIRRLLDAGATSVVLTFDPTTATEQLAYFAEHVLPAFVEGASR